jgi:hypothetical protein
VAFRVILSTQARYQLSQLSRPILDTILDCLNEIQADPYRDPDLRVTLVIPLYRIYPDAYLCGNWAIAYGIRGQDEVLVEAIGNHFY